MRILLLIALLITPVAMAGEEIIIDYEDTNIILDDVASVIDWPIYDYPTKLHIGKDVYYDVGQITETEDEFIIELILHEKYEKEDR